MPAITRICLVSRSIWRVSGVLTSGSSCSIPEMWPTSVAIPVAVTTNSPAPRLTSVRMYTMSVRSPRGVSAPATASVDLVTGRLSPVSADSATSSVAALNSRPSAGTISPASIVTISPGTSCSAGISASWPSRLTLALMITVFCRAATAAAAFPSWRRPITALASVSRTSRRPVPSCLSGYRLAMPAASSTICIGSRYWRRNECQRGSAFPVSNVLGPNRWARAAASAELSPRCPSTPSERRTWSAPSVCHPSPSTAGHRSDLGVSVAPEVMSVVSTPHWRSPSIGTERAPVHHPCRGRSVAGRAPRYWSARSTMSSSPARSKLAAGRSCSQCEQSFHRSRRCAKLANRCPDHHTAAHLTRPGSRAMVSASLCRGWPVRLLMAVPRWCRTISGSSIVVPPPPRQCPTRRIFAY